MCKHRIFILIGVILVAFVLVGTSLSAAGHAQQAAVLADVPKSILNNSFLSPGFGGINQPFRKHQTFMVSPGRSTETTPFSYPHMISRPNGEWQPQENGYPPSQLEGTLSDFGGWDSLNINSPTIFLDNGMLHMYYTGLDWNNSDAIGLATSMDAVSWYKDIDNPIFPDAVEASFLAMAPDDYRIYFSNYDNGSIYLVQSSDGGSTWNPYGTPMLIPTNDPTDWDRDFVCDPVVLYVGGTYYMFYEGGVNEPLQAQIGLATSSTGYTWSRVGDQPILTIGDPGDWDEYIVVDPMVIEDGGVWEMWYRGMNSNNERAIGYATSTDGQNWTKSGGNPVFTADPMGWDTGGPGGPWVMYENETYHMWYHANRQIGYATSDDGINWVREGDDAVLKPSPLLYLELNYGHDWIHAYTLPNEPVTVTLMDSEDQVIGTLYGEANDWGDFWSSDWSWDTGSVNIQPYESIFVEAAGLNETIDPIGEMVGEVDVDYDLVTGTLNASWLGDEVQMYCELWSEPWVNIDAGLVDGNGGSFECDYSAEGVDLQPGMQVAVIYIDQDGDRVMNILEPPWMRVNYAHDWVGGNYPAGHTFEITIKDSGDNVKAMAIISSEPGMGWGGDGFETGWDDWTPTQPDIVPGDWVIFETGDSFEDIVHVGDIQGTLDIEQDLISGPVYADWYTDDLNIECHPWGAPPNTPGKNSTAGPDGDPFYTCQWDPLTEWDIQPGQDVAVMYLQPENGDRVINVFYEPAPNMAINKWVEGSGLVTPGGPVIFNIAYGNNGDADAESFTITDTLPISTSYLTDTSGASVITGTGWVQWDFEALAPGEWKHFYVVLNNTANVGDVLGNSVEIDTAYDFDDSNDHAYAEAQVTADGYDIWVDKNPSPGDPTPGDTFIYQINVGNNNDTASGSVTLTETLPEGTSLVGWYSQSGYQLWKQISYADGILVLTTPSFSGQWGDSLRLTLEVDGDLEYGTQLTNTVEITTPGDIDPWNNWFQDTNAWVSPPRLDGRVNMWSPWGQIYPCGVLVYPISFYNDGNTTFDAVITDTLPEGLTFVDVHAWLHGVEFPFDPLFVDDEKIIWEYDALPPGEWIDMDVSLAIDPAYVPGTSALNCLALDSGSSDSSPWNNTVCNEYVIQDAGTNLRLTKNYWWNWEGQLQYSLDIQNIGSEALDNVWVTDTYPLSTTWNGNAWWWGPWITMTENLNDHQLSFWVDYMNPGDNAGIDFQVDLDGDIIGEKGLTFTNLAEAPIEGDVNTADNTVEVTAYTGADVFVHKWLSSGEPLPSEIITYTVEFGNLNQWPWDGDSFVGSHITDTLPEGMIFITATAPWNGNEFWTPENQDDGVLRWGWNTMWANNSWRFDLIVQLADDLKDGDVLTNSIEAYGDNPEDFDFDWSNNFDETSITIDIPTEQLFLPMVYK